MELTKIKGFGKAKAEELKKKGIEYLEDILVIPPPQYAEIIGADNETAGDHFKKAKEAYDKENKTIDFKTGSQCKSVDDNIERITTGTIALDKLFMGGIECGATSEIYGEFGSGKTQFCHTMACRVQLPKEKGGLEGKVIWVNTEGTFESTRIEAISESLGLDKDKTLDNILVADALNSVEQHEIMLKVSRMLINDKSIKLIIVDSATGLFKQDFSGRAMLSERQKYLDRFLTLCTNITKVHKVAIIWTNQVYISPTVFYGDPTIAVGGTVVSHKSTYRVYFSKSGKFRIAKMVDSPKSGQIEVMFGLSKSGIVDMDIAKEEEDERKKELTEMKKLAKSGKIDGTEEPTEKE